MKLHHRKLYLSNFVWLSLHWLPGFLLGMVFHAADRGFVAPGKYRFIVLHLGFFSLMLAQDTTYGLKEELKFEADWKENYGDENVEVVRVAR